jgi:hypothetical protein
VYKLSIPNLSFHLTHQEWTLKNTANAVFHWDLLDQANSDKLLSSSKEAILREGQSGADSRETLMFWINQVLIFISIFSFYSYLFLLHGHHDV